ncbi:MAG TPA: hypothetical protein VGP68_23120 [Gemmataceae bacterium]|jgi:hypothetical protein|nr:hypothetical protein [Gemmataceae bacterium]
MNRKAAVSVVACLLLGGAAWCSEPDRTDAPAPGILPIPSASPTGTIISDGSGPGLVTPSSTIFMSTPNSTPAYDMSFPNVIGGLQAGSSLAFGPAGPVRVPLFSRSSYTISDNESPKPQDRVFVDFNYFNEATAGSTRLDIYRETFGFEKTFLDGNASVGLRVPIVQANPDISEISGDALGDISVILKYAIINDQPAGKVVSAGLVVTAPTGKSIPTVVGDIHPTLIQPFFGYTIPCTDLAFVQGFSSLIVSTDSRDTTLWCSTISLGYWLYRCDDGGGTLRSIAPAVEAQFATPFDHRNNDSLIYYPDVMSMTAGVHLGLWHRSTLTVGAMTPVIGPKPYEVGAVAQFNMKF